MTIKTLARKGVPKRDIARQLNMSEGNIRYHLRRIESENQDTHDFLG
ncbi:winged helix-turn-helix transcriptional regulator [Wenzhouxiangella sp. EGI_FJ10409]